MPRPADRPKSPWTDGEILRESERWIYVPPAGTCLWESERLVVLLPAGQGASRVWRSRPDRTGAEALILQTVRDARAAGSAFLVWHTGDAVAPPLMEDLLPEHGFEKTEDLDVLAFELGTAPEPELPDLGVPPDIHAWTIEDAADLHRAHAIEAAVFPKSTPNEPDAEAYLQGFSALRSEAPHPPREGDPPHAFRSLASVPDPEDGEPRIAATAGAELAGATLRLWGAGTLPEHRGRGAYRALVLQRCRYAHALGASLALTKANAATSASLLLSAGFRPIARERRYLLKVPGPRA